MKAQTNNLHKIQHGDTLSGIVSKYWGASENKWLHFVAKYNGIKDINKIQAGNNVFIPNKATHIVKPGDNLSKISEKYLNSGQYKAYHFIANFNSLEDPNKIKAGMSLDIPLVGDDAPFAELET